MGVAKLDAPGAACRLVNQIGLSVLVGDVNHQPMSDAQLSYLGNGSPGLGMGGLVCTFNYFYGLGGSEQWTGNASDTLAGGTHLIQKAIKDTNFVQRCHDRGITKLYLGTRLASYFNGQTPLKEWFDDAGWTQYVIPAFTGCAAAAKLMGFDGLYWDGEPLPGYGAPAPYTNQSGTFDWNYEGNTHTETQVRAQVKLRGVQVMQAMLNGYGDGIELVTYRTDFPGDFNNLQQHVGNGSPWYPTTPMQGASACVENFIDGLTSVNGYGFLHFADAAFYWGPQYGNEQTAMIVDSNGACATFSRILSNWKYANQRVSRTPMFWMGPTNGDGSGGSQTLTTAAMALQKVQDGRVYGMSGLMVNFDYGDVPITHANLSNFVGSNSVDNGNYEPAYQAATAGTVDSTPPTLSSIVSSRVDAGHVNLSGVANDNIGVRAIRWAIGSNSGAAVHQFIPTTTYSPHGVVVPDTNQTPGNFHWHTTWAANGIPATAGQTVQLTVEDVKGRTANYSKVV